MSMDGYPPMESGQYSHEGYVGGGGFGAPAEAQSVAPFEGLGVEDNQLLWSVLSSTPVPEQYNLAYPQSAPPNNPTWDTHGGFSGHTAQFSGYPGHSMPQHMPANMGAPRATSMLHHGITSQMHQSVTSTQSHMAAQVPSSTFSHQPVHNPFSLRNDAPNAVHVKHEGGIPLFTPANGPYAATGQQPMGAGFGAQLYGAHAPGASLQGGGQNTPTMQAKVNRAAPVAAQTSPYAAPSNSHFLRSSVAKQEDTNVTGTSAHDHGTNGGAQALGAYESQNASKRGAVSAQSASSASSAGVGQSSNSASTVSSSSSAAAAADDVVSGDEFDEESGPRNRRRESQNRASRNYRQRKKAYIKEMEAKLDALKMEVEVLRTENQKNRRMLSQYQGDKPAPLIRSYSSELQDEEKEIDKLVTQLNERANSQDATEEDLRILLSELHERMGRRQQLLNKEAIQLINPKMQERFARLEATPQHQLDEQMGQWLDQVAQFVSQEQISKLAELKQKHFAARAAIWDERSEINNDIKEFYQEKVASERLNTPGRIDPTSLSTLTHKLEALKKNLIREDELNTGSVDQFSSILTPYQEAIITVKHYAHYKDKLSAIHMLQNVWSVLSKQDK